MSLGETRLRAAGGPPFADRGSGSDFAASWSRRQQSRRTAAAPKRIRETAVPRRASACQAVAAGGRPPSGPSAASRRRSLLRPDASSLCWMMLCAAAALRCRSAMSREDCPVGRRRRGQWSGQGGHWARLLLTVASFVTALCPVQSRRRYFRCRGGARAFDSNHFGVNQEFFNNSHRLV